MPSTVDSKVTRFISRLAFLTNQLTGEIAEFEILDTVPFRSCNAPRNRLIWHTDVETEDVLNKVANRPRATPIHELPGTRRIATYPHMLQQRPGNTSQPTPEP